MKVHDGDFQEMDMGSLQFEERHFDAGWSKASLMHLPKKSIKSYFEENEIRNYLKDFSDLQIEKYNTYAWLAIYCRKKDLFTKI